MEVAPWRLREDLIMRSTSELSHAGFNEVAYSLIRKYCLGMVVPQLTSSGTAVTI